MSKFKEAKKVLFKMIEEAFDVADVKANETEETPAEQVEITLEESTLKDSETIIKWGEVGSPVVIIEPVAEGEEGEPVESPAPEGEHIIADDKVIVVDSDGNLVEVKEVEETPEEEVEQVEAKVETETTCVEANETETPTEETEEVVNSNFNVESLAELVDTSKDGWHSIEFEISDGNVTWGQVYSNTVKSLMSQVEQLSNEKKEVETKLETALSATPVEAENLKQNTGEEKVKLSRAEILAARSAEKRKNK